MYGVRSLKALAYVLVCAMAASLAVVFRGTKLTLVANDTKSGGNQPTEAIPYSRVHVDLLAWT